jgi:polyisoprenoid-binding protein YceI
MKTLFTILSLVIFSNTASAELEQYTIDNKHSFVNFSIRHVVSKTTGTFSDVTGVINIDRDNLAKSNVNAIIKVASVNTSMSKRDEHIQKSDYLDAINFGEITFVSKKIKSISTTEGLMTGDFTLHGVTKEITIPFKVLGFGADPWGGQRSGFEASTLIKASDYGFTWMKKPNAPVGDDVEITLLIEGIKVTK